MSSRIFYLLIFLIQACTTSGTNSNTQTQPLHQFTAIQLADAIREGSITSEQAVSTYLKRIEQYDTAGPMIQSIISLNPDALNEAKVLDREAQQGLFRGRLHGVPILVKDNIETLELPTTAGSMALLANDTKRDAPVIAQLRQHGAIILGKTNLSEWANFRSKRSLAGWSGVGGQTRNPHSLDRSVCGSSSGSGAAVAAYFAPIALGTETNGSITCPAAANGIVGYKPTIGLLPQTNIVPLSISQDSAGPMTRTVQDAALMITLMAEPETHNDLKPASTRNYLKKIDQSISGIRIGVFRWADGNNKDVSESFNKAIETLKAEGAVLVDINEFSPPPILWQSGDKILQTEFKHAINAYLSTTPGSVKTRNLQQLIQFNKDHSERELSLFDQSIFIQSNGTKGIRDLEYIKLAKAVKDAAQKEGIDLLLDRYNVEVLVMPTAAPATPLDVAFTSRRAGKPIGAGWLAAMAGYPILTVPMDDVKGLPIGLSIMGTAWDDATVLMVGHAFEKSTRIRITPTFSRGPFDHSSTAQHMRSLKRLKEK